MKGRNVNKIVDFNATHLANRPGLLCSSGSLNGADIKVVE